jgi:hypothetical protein
MSTTLATDGDSAEDRVNEILRAREGKPTQRKGRGNPPVEHRFQPGQSGNPAGMVPGTISLKAILKAKLAEVPEGRDRRTIAEQLVDSTCKAALRGDAQARRLIWESIEGTARQQVTVGVEYDPLMDILAAMKE